MKQFVVSQVVLLLVAVCCGWSWYPAANLRPRIPRFNDQPRVVRPEYNYPFVVSDDQLQQVLVKIKPRFLTVPTKVNFVDHGIRLWGSKIKFYDDSLDGPEMLNLLLDDSQFRNMWGKQAPALLHKTDFGISVLTQQGRSTVSHVDHMTGTLAEIGIPLSHPVVTRSGQGQVADLLRHTILSFQLNQKEYEWTALAAAFYTADAEPWYSNEGQRIDFNLLAERIMRQRQPLGVCYGQHRLYTLVMLLRINEQMQVESGKRLLDPTAEQSVKDYLLGMTRRFHQTQALDGYWDGNWPDKKKAVPDPGTDELSRRILATGHVLEWWAMAPEELHPPRATIVRSAQWLSRVIIEMDDRTIEKNYTFLTHAARCLALWRSKFAYEVPLNTQVENDIPNTTEVALKSH